MEPTRNNNVHIIQDHNSKGTRLKTSAKTNANNSVAIYYYLPFWLWTIALWIGTSIPGSVFEPPPIFSGDKIIHLLAYTGVGFFLMRLSPYINSSRWQNSPRLMTFLLGVSIGIADELHQILIPGRFFEVADMIADIFGIILGIFLYQSIIKRIPKLK